MPAHSEELDRWIAQRHYLQSTPYGARLRLWVIEKDQIVGAMMWGRPTARKLDQQRILELTRMVFVNDTSPYIESQALAMARKVIRTEFPAVLAYSSIGEGHRGVVYAADGWCPIGTTRGAPWNGRPGRANRDTSAKIRWFRSP